MKIEDKEQLLNDLWKQYHKVCEDCGPGNGCNDCRGCPSVVKKDEIRKKIKKLKTNYETRRQSDMENIIEIPEGYEVRIKGNKVIFEPKESEDEKIRKFLIRQANSVLESITDDDEEVPAWKSALAWLEKQGEKKPTDNVEPKFKVGDWITNGEYTWKVTDIKSLDYILQSPNGDVVDDIVSYVDEHLHLWTIQDAEDGDVLYHKSPLTGIEYIVMSRGVNGYGAIDSYFRYNSDDGFGFNIPSVFSAKLNDITPATKEQRDFLFQKMKEVGYEWDAKKKELTKIEQNLADSYCQENCKGFQETGKCFADGECDAKRKAKQKPAWSEEDENMRQDIISGLKAQIQLVYAHDEQGKAQMNSRIDWLKSLKPRWKPTEEQMEALVIAIHDAHGRSYCKNLYSLYNDLKSL